MFHHHIFTNFLVGVLKIMGGQAHGTDPYPPCPLFVILMALLMTSAKNKNKSYWELRCGYDM
jgi:hypothetical protein